MVAHGYTQEGEVFPMELWMRLAPPKLPSAVLPLLLLASMGVGVATLGMAAARLLGWVDWSWTTILAPLVASWLIQLIVGARFLLRIARSRRQAAADRPWEGRIRPASDRSG